MNKEEFDAAKRALEVKQLQRKDRLAALNEYVGFAVSKLAGLGALVFGGLDIINPSLIPHIPHPEYALGTGLALLCDFTLAVPEAKFGYTEVRIGFVPAIVSTFLLRQVGEKIARDLLLTGRIFDAPEALKMGVINEIVPPEKLLDRARELAAQLAENSPLSLSNTKRLLTDHARAELDAQIEAAIRENAGIRESADFREGIEAFLEKRKPKWTGR